MKNEYIKPELYIQAVSLEDIILESTGVGKVEGVWDIFGDGPDIQI